MSRLSGCRLFINGDECPVIVRGTPAEIVERIEAGGPDFSHFIAFESIEADGRSPRSLFVRPGAVNAITPMLPGDLRVYLDSIDEEVYDDA